MTIFDSVKEGITFIENNLNNDIGVLEVADSVSYSQFYFSREFSKYVHISVYDYIIRRKLSEAYKTLFKEEQRIVDLAFYYGFQSHEVFSRAFRKLFGENPSEVKVYKPYLIYETIDESYLLFLKDLKIKHFDRIISEASFEVISTTNINDVNGVFLLLLSNDDAFRYSCTLQGNLHDSETANLCFRLNHLIHKLRIYSKDGQNSLRYFIDNIFDANEIGSNYILCMKENDYIDFYISIKP